MKNLLYSYVCIILWCEVLTQYKVYTPTDTFRQMIFVVFNSGKHAPLPEYKKLFPNNTLTFRSEDRGQLTPEGRQQMYRLGVKIRRRYHNNSFFTNFQSKLQMLSMYNRRSREGAKLVIAGLLNQSRSDSLNKKWKSDELAHIYSLDTHFDNLLRQFYTHENCSEKYIRELRNIFDKNDKANRKKLSEHKCMKQRLKKYLKLKRLRPMDVLKMYDLFTSQKNAKIRQIPEWLTEDLLFDMKDYINTYLPILLSTDSLKQQSAGVFIEHMATLMDIVNKDRYAEVPKVILFSTDDITFATIVAALGGTKGFVSCGKDVIVKWPSPGDAVILEQHVEGKTFDTFIQIHYWKPDSLHPEQMHIKGCSGCNYYTYVSTIHKIRYSETEAKKCSANNKMPK